jgi:dolichol-phosphate mannosyltransferase
MDAGMTHKPADVSRFLEQAEATGSDLVIGSRFLSRSFRGYRTMISYSAAFLMRRLGINVRDATSGFRCWRANRLATLDFSQVQARGFAFQLELLYFAWSSGGKVSEMPIEYRLTNSSFNSKMLIEALKVYTRLWCHSLAGNGQLKGVETYDDPI